MGMNKRHDIDPELVSAQIETKVADIARDLEVQIKRCDANQVHYAEAVANGTAARNWSRPPDTADCVREIYTSWIKHEHEVYSTVRVIELPKPGKRFILVYGDVNDDHVEQGTGPFASLDEAKMWFLKGGR